MDFQLSSSAWALGLPARSHFEGSLGEYRSPCSCRESKKRDTAFKTCYTAHVNPGRRLLFSRIWKGIIGAIVAKLTNPTLHMKRLPHRPAG